MVGLDTLEYLHKGGRIGAAAKWAGTLLKVKPLVTFNVLTNLVEPIGLVRTYTAMIETLYRKFFERVKGMKNLRVAVLHGSALEHAEELRHASALNSIRWSFLLIPPDRWWGCTQVPGR